MCAPAISKTAPSARTTVCTCSLAVACRACPGVPTQGILASLKGAFRLAKIPSVGTPGHALQGASCSKIYSRALLAGVVSASASRSYICWKPPAGPRAAVHWVSSGSSRQQPAMQHQFCAALHTQTALCSTLNFTLFLDKEPHRVPRAAVQGACSSRARAGGEASTASFPSQTHQPWLPVSTSTSLTCHPPAGGYLGAQGQRCKGPSAAGQGPVARH